MDWSDIVNVFVSYTMRDSYITHTLLDEISASIETIGKPFVDALHNDSRHHQSTVDNALRSADVVVLLESDSVFLSPWVRWELHTAAKINVPILRLPITRQIRSTQPLTADTQETKANRSLHADVAGRRRWL